jgi:hypothetical protein
MVSTRIRTCFISAPFDANTETIKDVLRSQEVGVLGADDYLLGANIVETTHDMIAEADLVIGVLSGDGPQLQRNNLIFELGLALGLRKQVVVFSPPKRDIVPFESQQRLVIRANLQNREAMDFALRQVLASPERSGSPRRHSDKTVGRELGAEADTRFGIQSEIQIGIH